MNKEKWLVIFMFIIMIIVSCVLFFMFKDNLTGLVVGNVSFEMLNDAPIWSTIPNQTWTMNTNKVIDLSDYSSDSENYSLIYSSTYPLSITVSIAGSNATLIPDAGFTGHRTIQFIAYDYVNTVYSNTVYLEVNSSYVKVPSSSSGGAGNFDTEGKVEKTMYYAGEVVEFEDCVNKTYFLKNLFEGDFASLEINNCNIIYFEDEINGFIYVSLITENYILLDIEESNGLVNQVKIFANESYMIDINSDGLDDYSIEFSNIGSNINLEFKKVEHISFPIIGEQYISDYRWIILVLIIVFLISLVFAIKILKNDWYD